MTLNELVQAMRIDLGDPDGVLFADTALERCLVRAMIPVGVDTQQPLRLVNGEIVPTLDGMRAELLLLLAESYACGIMRGKTANAVTISSGDKRLERSNQTKSWADMAADLLAAYQQRITDMAGSDYFITPPPMVPVLFEQGIGVDDR